MVPVAALPRARTTVRSLTGNHGSRSGRRVQTGIRPIAAATRAPYPGLAAQGRGGCQTRKETASRACSVAASSGRKASTAAVSPASVVGGSRTPSLRATTAVWATYSSRPAWSSGRLP